MSTELVEYDQPSLSLIDRAIERGVDADSLSKLVELDQSLRRQRAKEEFYRAMHACQLEMPVVVKDKENPKTHSRFASLETVKKNAKPIYTKHGFTLSFSEVDCPLADHKRTRCIVRHNLGYEEEHSVDIHVDGIGPKGEPIGGMNKPQGDVSSLSYGERVLTCMIFDLTIANSDRDGNSQGLGDKQVETVNTLIEKWAPTDEELRSFFGWLGVESLDLVPATKFNDVCRQLNRKIAQGRK